MTPGRSSSAWAPTSKPDCRSARRSLRRRRAPGSSFLGVGNAHEPPACQDPPPATRGLRRARRAGACDRVLRRMAEARPRCPPRPRAAQPKAHPGLSARRQVTSPSGSAGKWEKYAAVWLHFRRKVSDRAGARRRGERYGLHRRTPPRRHRLRTGAERARDGRQPAPCSTQGHSPKPRARPPESAGASTAKR